MEAKVFDLGLLLRFLPGSTHTLLAALEWEHEIGVYPAPITACDAQFNHLLERRRAIGRELRRLNDLSDAEVIDESQFVEACEYLSEIEKRTLRRSAPRE